MNNKLLVVFLVNLLKHSLLTFSHLTAPLVLHQNESSQVQGLSLLLTCSWWPADVLVKVTLTAPLMAWWRTWTLHMADWTNHLTFKSRTERSLHHEVAPWFPGKPRETRTSYSWATVWRLLWFVERDTGATCCALLRLRKITSNHMKTVTARGSLLCHGQRLCQNVLGQIDTLRDTHDGNLTQ